MPDERTVSDFTRINTRLRSHQEVRTLVDMTQIRQWERYNPEVYLSNTRHRKYILITFSRNSRASSARP